MPARDKMQVIGSLSVFLKTEPPSNILLDLVNEKRLYKMSQKLNTVI